MERGADLHMAQLMPLLLIVSCFSKIQIGLPFWCRLTTVVPEKGPLNGCVCVCVCVWLLLTNRQHRPGERGAEVSDQEDLEANEQQAARPGRAARR